jgi:hypothetical protein
MPDKDNRKIEGKVTFVQNSLPALDAGEYELKISQLVDGVHGDKIAKDEIKGSECFIVRGERFKLDPADLHSVFPPDNASGEYASTLPHVVLERISLPWERSPLATGAMKTKAGENVPAWLGILVVDDGDLAEFPAFNPQPRTAKVADFFQPQLGACLSCFGSARPVDALDYGESVEDPCFALDMPLELFRAVAPSLEDLKLLAHVRSMIVENQEMCPGDDGTDEEGVGYSVVIGNRLPVPERKTYAYLVSLEGLGSWLPGGGNAGDGTIRLIVLKSWSYSAVDQDKPGADFVKILKGLDVDVLSKKPAGSAEDAAADAQIKQALALGYVPLAHDMRGGSLTVSWYRGPLQPNPHDRELLLPITSADKATRYDPDSGLLDVSYSAAWQIGRLLALQDKTYSSALYSWKRELEQQLVAEAAGDIAHLPFKPILKGEPRSELENCLLGALKEQLK